MNWIDVIDRLARLGSKLPGSGGAEKPVETRVDEVRIYRHARTGQLMFDVWSKDHSIINTTQAKGVLVAWFSLIEREFSKQ